MRETGFNMVLGARNVDKLRIVPGQTRNLV